MFRHGLSEQFEAVCRAHPPRTFVHKGVAWHYRVAGHGAQGLLLLPGAVGDGEAYFLLLPSIVNTHRAMAIRYPPVERLDDLLEGLHALALHEGATSVDIVGGSFGGLVAQAFLQRYPSFTRRVTLSATGPAKRERAATNDKWARIIGRLPLAVSRMLLRAIVRVALKRTPEDREFWRDFYFAAIARLSKADARSRYMLSAEMDRHGPVSPADVAGWTGSMLMVEGGSDRIAHSDAGDALEALYPRAERRTFPGAGHAVSAEKPREWAVAVTEFLTATQV